MRLSLERQTVNAMSKLAQGRRLIAEAEQALRGIQKRASAARKARSDVAPTPETSKHQDAPAGA